MHVVAESIWQHIAFEHCGEQLSETKSSRWRGHLGRRRSKLIFKKHTKSPQQHRCHESAVRSFQRQHKLTRLRLLGWDTTVGITESTVADDAHDNEYFHSHSHRLERCPLLLFRTVGTRTVAGRMGNGNYRSIIVERRCAAVVIGTAVAWLRGQRQHR